MNIPKKKKFAILQVRALAPTVKFRYGGEWWLFSTTDHNPFKAYYFREVTPGRFTTSYKTFEPTDQVGVFNPA